MEGSLCIHRLTDGRVGSRIYLDLKRGHHMLKASRKNGYRSQTADLGITSAEARVLCQSAIGRLVRKCIWVSPDQF
jgi:hypothetical protein